MVSEALKKQLTLDKQEERETDPASTNLSAAAKRPRVDEDKTPIESEIRQHLVNKSDFNFVKMHFLNHFSAHICQLGNLLNVSFALPEKAMMDLKQAYQQSKWHEAAFQILQTKAPKEVCQCPELNANAAKQCSDDDMPPTKMPIKVMMKNPLPEIKTLDDLPELCAMPMGELQNHIAWCFKRFADFTDYVDHDQCFSRLNDAKLICCNSEAVPVTSCQCTEQAVHSVRCTGSIRSRKHQPPRNDTVLLWMGRVQIATISRRWDAFPDGWSVMSYSRMLNRALKCFSPWFRCLQLRQYVRLLVWWLSRRGINLRCNPRTMEATFINLVSAAEPLISSLQVQS